MTRAEWDRAVAMVRRAGLGRVDVVDGADYRSAYVCEVVHEADAPERARVWLAVALETGARFEMGTPERSRAPRSRVLTLSVYWDEPQPRLEDEPVGVDDEECETNPGRGIPRTPGDRF